MSGKMRLFARQKTKKGIWFGALLLASVVLGVTPMSIRSAKAYEIVGDEGNENLQDKNFYALKVSTGVKSGEDVSAFVISYRDESGVSRREYVYMNQNPSRKSLNYAAKYCSLSSKEVERMKLFSKNLGYNGAISTNSDISIWIDEAVASPKELESNTTNTMFFRTSYRIASLEGIGVMTEFPGRKAVSWDCNGIELYRVHSVDGLSMGGYVSSELMPKFTGEIIGSLNFTPKNSKNPSMKFEFSQEGITFINANGVDAPDSEITDYSAYKASFNSMSGLIKNSGKEYMVKIDLADVYLGGLEEYAADPSSKQAISKVMPAESLVLEFTYKTPSGMIYTVDTPVLTSSIAYAYETGKISSSTTLGDLFAQGSSVAFPVNLPDYSKMVSAKMIYVSSEDELKKLVGLSSTSGAAAAHQNHYSGLSRTSDSLTIAGMQLFENTTDVSVSVQNSASLCAQISGGASPLYYYLYNNNSMKTNSKGQILSIGNSIDMPLTAYKAGAAITQKPAGNQYLLEIKTADSTAAATQSDIKAELNYYSAKENREISVEVDLKEACNEYYGYWKGRNGENVAYSLGMQPGGTLYVLMNISDVDYFTGASFSNEGDDDWQISDFSIYYVKEISPIMFAWAGGASEITNCTHFRKVNGQIVIPQEMEAELEDLSESEICEDMSGDSNCIARVGDMGDNGSEGGEPGLSPFDPNASGGVYIGGNQKQSVDFSGRKVSEVEDIGTDIFAYYYNMDYDIATSNLGFNQSKYTYHVKVNVGDEPNNDDCGSRNYFYFQLIFENGTSGYVQANQQLESDGFRENAKESFSISVNRDYGEVVGINILPETDPDLGDPYDKLKIDSIEVTRSMGNGLSQTYRIEDVNWIGIDYSEQESKKIFHTEAQLAKSFGVTSVDNSAQILFSIGTGNCSLSSLSDSANQFVGTLYATIDYVDTDGISQKSDPINVIQRLREFNGSSVKTTSQKDEVISDDKYMFRINSTDRFIWEASNISQLSSITFEATNRSGKKVNWVVNSVGASLIQGGSLRDINSAGEYILKDGKYLDVASSDSSSPYSMMMEADQTSAVTIQFSKSTGNILSQAGITSTPYVISKTPVSENDTVNIYAYVSDKSADPSEFTTSGTLVYTDVYGDTRKSSSTFRYSAGSPDVAGGRRVLYYKGLSVKKFSVLNYMELKANGKSNKDVLVDYIIVQQIRNGVVVATYKCSYASEDTCISYSNIVPRTVSVRDASVSSDYQTVSIQFGSDMLEEKLTSKKYDLAVAFQYKSSLGTSDEIYQTPFMYLTECGISSIGPGDVVDLKMNEGGVSEIVGMKIATTWYLKADVDCATIGTYKANIASSATGEGDFISYDCTGYYSFGNGNVVQNETKSFDVTCAAQDTTETISTLRFTFDTMEKYEGIGNNTGLSESDKIRMIIHYKQNDEDHAYTIDNLNDYLVSGSFAAGKTAEVAVMAKGITSDNISSVILIPYDSNIGLNQVWGLEAMRVSFGEGQTSDDEKFVSLEKLLYEDGQDNIVSFANVVLTAEAYKAALNEESGKFEATELLTRVNQTKPGVFNLDYSTEGSYVKFFVNVSNSENGYEVEFDEGGRGNAAVVEQGTDVYNNQYFVVKFDGVRGSNVSRSVKISSRENPNCFVTVDVVIYYTQATSMEVSLFEGEDDENTVGNAFAGGTISIERDYREEPYAFRLENSLGDTDDDFYCEYSEGVTFEENCLYVTGEEGKTVTRTAKVISRDNPTLYVNINFTVKSAEEEPGEPGTNDDSNQGDASSGEPGDAPDEE